jgi:hypothetical protein
MDTYRDFDEARVKHLELIQAVISRLGNDGFLMKGWAITLAAAFLAFAVNSDDVWLAVASVFPTGVFWGLDAYFLRAERLFRKLYGRVREGSADIAPFFMSATAPTFTRLLSQEEKAQLSWWKIMRRPSLFWFYLAIVAAAVAVASIVLAVDVGSQATSHGSPSMPP